jgi:hypothetical protein
MSLLQYQATAIISVSDLIKKDIITEAKNMGHYNTGKSFLSIEVIGYINGKDLVFEVHGPIHLAYVNNGVAADKIPFSPGSGASSSQYIDGLIDYFRSKGFFQDEAEDLAWATAMKRFINKLGSPTPGSFRFSKTGKRTGVITDTFDDRKVIYSEILMGQAQEGIYAELSDLTV